MSVAQTILKLGKQLYPTGRAFKIPEGGYFERLNSALAEIEAQAFSGGISILDSTLPDNNNFTAQDATDWERRLGIVVSPLVALPLRKAAIIRKINHPGTIKARQNFRYLEGQLQAAGFSVFVYENRFEYGGSYDTANPLTLTGGVGALENQYGDNEYGEAQYGISFPGMIANHINEDLDANFDTGANLRSTFFIGGSPLGTFASVPLNRKNEFRQLVLRIKPVQTVAFLFINFV